MMDDETFRETVGNMRNRTTKMEREGDYWSDYEKEKLKKLFYAGVGITEIAVQLQRTEPAVFQQIEKMDLYGRKENPQRRRNSCKEAVCLCRDCQFVTGCTSRCMAAMDAREAV